MPTSGTCRGSALLLLLLLPAGGCGVVRGVLFGTSAIEVCNDAAVGDIVASIDLVNAACGDPFGVKERSGSCEGETDEELWPGDCRTFGGLEPGAWTVRIHWIGGATAYYLLDASLFETAVLSLEFGG